MVLLGLFGAAGAFGAYAFSLLFPVYIWGFGVGWAGFSSITLWQVWEKRRSIQRQQLQLRKDSQVTSIDLARRGASVRGPHPDFSLLEKLVTTFEAAGMEVANAAADLLPLTDKVIKHQDRRTRRDSFVEGYAAALARYGYPIDDAAKILLAAKLWAFDGKGPWLKNAIHETQRIYPNVSTETFELFYYEYLGPKQSWDSSWTAVKGSESLRAELSKVLVTNQLLLNGGLNQEAIPALTKLMEGMPQYTLSDVQERAVEFFDKLAEFKLNCITYLGFYGLRLVTTRDALISYVPRNPDPKDWRDNVLAYLSILIDQDSDVLNLLVKDSIGDAGSLAAWKKVTASGKVPLLARALAIGRIKKTSSEVNDDTFLSHLAMCIESQGDEFSVAKIETAVESLEGAIVTCKRNIQTCARQYHLKLENSAFSQFFKPTQLTKVEADYVKEAALENAIDPDLFAFLYETVVNPKSADANYSEFVRKNSLLLSKQLIASGFAPGGDFAPNVELLLKRSPSFNLPAFVQSVSFYERLYQYSRATTTFMEAHHVYNGTTLDFDQVLSLCPSDSSLGLDDHLVTVASKMLASGIGEKALGVDQAKELAITVTLLFLNQNREPAFRKLCEKLYYCDFGSRVLYRHLFLSEGRLRTEPSTLFDAAKAVLDSPAEGIQYLHLEYFRSQLLAGQLPQTASSMLAVQIQSLREDLNRAQKNGFEAQVIENYLQPISDLLNQKINEEIVRDFLTTKVISAYLITVPGTYGGIGFLKKYETVIGEVADDLAVSEKDDTYSALLKIDKGSGTATRIGLVPFGMGFEEFSMKVERLLSQAVKRANAGLADDDKFPDPLPYYIVRIFPSEDALQEIMRRADVKTSPFGIVTDLVKDQMGTQESLTLLSLLQRTGESNLAFKQVIASIVDHHKSSIFTLTKDVTEGVLNQVPGVKKKFERGEVDRLLCKVYEAPRLSDLCVKITSLLHEIGRDSTIAGLKANLTQLVPDLRGVSSDGLDVISRAIVARLNSVGTALELNV